MSSKLAALVPLPRIHLTRYYGVLAPHHSHRSEVIKNKITKKENQTHPDESCGQNFNRAKMTWAKRLKRVFEIDITVCSSCGGMVKIGKWLGIC